MVLYDEHGGFFDHVSPPADVPNPDGKTSDEPPFDFTRLGVRVPALLVSPWLEKGRIDSNHYEHASVARTVKEIFGLPRIPHENATRPRIIFAARKLLPGRTANGRAEDITGSGEARNLRGVPGSLAGFRSSFEDLSEEVRAQLNAMAEAEINDYQAQLLDFVSAHPPSPGSWNRPADRDEQAPHPGRRGPTHSRGVSHRGHLACSGRGIGAVSARYFV